MPAKPSREHKFKASDLRRHFGEDEMYVGSTSDNPRRGKIAQGVDSKHLKFTNPICERCNSHVTQESDRAYDEFVAQIERRGSTQEAAYEVLADPKFCIGSPLYIPLFRYFAKLLGCHLSEDNAPIPLHLSRFVAKKTERNCICLEVRRDITFDTLADTFSGDDLKYAAHGGLAIITKKPKLLPTKLYSTMTIGPIQFIFYSVLTVFEIWEMRLRHSDFIRRCAEAAQREIDNPIPHPDLEQLGLDRRGEN